MKSRAIEFEVVFKEDDWEIRKTNGEYAFAQIAVIIYHQCKSVHSTGAWKVDPRVWLYRNELHLPCSFCQEAPPDHIQAMFQFLNYNCPEAK